MTTSLTITRTASGFNVTTSLVSFTCVLDPDNRRAVRMKLVSSLEGREISTGDLSDMLQACWRVRAWKENGVSPGEAAPPIVSAYRYLLRDLERNTPKFEKIALVKTRIQALIAEAMARHTVRTQ